MKSSLTQGCSVWRVTLLPGTTFRLSDSKYLYFPVLSTWCEKCIARFAIEWSAKVHAYIRPTDWLDFRVRADEFMANSDRARDSISGLKQGRGSLASWGWVNFLFYLFNKEYFSTFINPTYQVIIVFCFYWHNVMISYSFIYGEERHLIIPRCNASFM